MARALENIKEDILMASKTLLAEEGYEKLNIRAIASKCGIATGTLYNYYKSKHEIMEEILKIEWQMMLRRIQQFSKTGMNNIEKLEKVYTELCIIMNNVHNIWFSDTCPSNDLSSIKSHKELLLKSLADKILQIINNEKEEKEQEEQKDYSFISEVICKLFISYAYQGDVEFKKLSPVIESILK